MESVYVVGVVTILLMLAILTWKTDRMEEKIDRLLKSQTEPKKPKDLRYLHRDEIGGDCPSCGGVVLFAQRHCHNCTQLLDWTEAVTWSVDDDEEYKPIEYVPDKNGWQEGAYLKEDK